MRAGPLSNANVVSLLNRYFVPVYAINEEYRKDGTAPAAERAEYQRIYREALKAKLSAGTVHVYIVTPDGHPIDSLHVGTASKVEKLVDLLEGTIKKLKVAEGKPLVKPAPQSAPPKAEAGTLVLHLTARYLFPKGKELVPLGKDARLGQTRHGSWAALPSENWILLDRAEAAKFLPPGAARPGTAWEVSKDVAAKILTYFYPQTENNNVAKNRIDRLALKATVVSVKDGVARVRLDGSLRMKHTFYHKDDDSFVDAAVVGFMEVDTARKKVRKLELVTDRATYRDRPFGVAVRSLP
jgi:hypothetical protein